jgi:hypothetical protein
VHFNINILKTWLYIKPLDPTQEFEVKLWVESFNIINTQGFKNDRIMNPRIDEYIYVQEWEFDIKGMKLWFEFPYYNRIIANEVDWKITWERPTKISELAIMFDLSSNLMKFSKGPEDDFRKTRLNKNFRVPYHDEPMDTVIKRWNDSDLMGKITS